MCRNKLIFNTVRKYKLAFYTFYASVVTRQPPAKVSLNDISVQNQHDSLMYAIVYYDTGFL